MPMHDHRPSVALGPVRPLRTVAQAQPPWWARSVPAWVVLGLLPVAAVVLGGALASMSAP